MATATADASNLRVELEELGVGGRPSPTLPIHSASSAYESVPSFSDQTCVGRFRINEDKSYTRQQDISYAKAQLIPQTNFPGLTGRDLSFGYEAATLIDNYQKHHELKQEFFMKWLMEEDYFTKHTKPDFICFGGRITIPLMTPEMKFGNWDVYATKFQDVIYLWNERKQGDERAIIKTDLVSYYGIYFEHLLTTSENTAALSVPNEYDKVCVINQVKFGSYQLLVLGEVDAVDEDGELAELKVHRECYPRGMRAKYLKYWAQSTVPGIKKLVIGRRDGNGRLLEIKSTTTDELARANKINTNTLVCLDFEDRLLKWMKECFRNDEDDGNVVKKFSWTCGNGSVTVTNVPKQDIPKCLIPSWFVEKMKKGPNET